MPKPKSTAAYTGPMHPVGTKVELVRPNMWAEDKGVIEAFGGRMHIIRVHRPNQKGFLVAAPFEELKVDTTGSTIPHSSSQPSSKE